MMGLSELRAENEARARRGEKRLNVSASFSLSLDFVTSTQAILAKKGSGKSYTASVQAEELLEAGQQIVVIDPVGSWFGLRSSSDGTASGYPIAVIGGEHADVPLEATAGEVIADAIATEHFSAIVDLTLLRKGESLRFMAAFLETLYRKNRDAMHLFLDEADTVAPQKPFGEEARTLGAAEDIVRRGRRRGIGCTLITQRPQVLSKNVLSQVDMLTALRMNHPKDLAAIDEWVRVHGDPAQAKAMIESLPSLPIGDAWVWSPAMDVFERATIRRRRTFDSGRTPKAGERALAPNVLAQVDIARLGKAIAATVERTKQDDPKALRARIAELEKRDGGSRTVEKIVEKRVEVPIISEGQMANLTRLVGAAREIFERGEETLDNLGVAIKDIEATIQNCAPAKSNRDLAAEHFANDGKVSKRVGKHEIRVPAPKPVDKPVEKPAAPTSDGHARQRVLDAIFELRAANIDVTHLAVAAWLALHPKTKTLLVAIGELRESGFLDGLTLTQPGLLEVTSNLDMPSEHRQREKLRAGLSESMARTIDTIKTIGETGRGPISHAKLAAWLGVHPKTNSLLEDIGRLRERGYIDGLVLTEIGDLASLEGAAKSSFDLIAPLDDGQRKIAELVVRGGSIATMTALAEKLGLHPKTNSLLDAVGKLRKRGFVSHGWPLVLTDIFPEAR